MKALRNLSLIVVALLFVMGSCQEEEIIQNNGTNNEDVVAANSKVADLIRKTTLKDGSNDNIIDSANCLSVALPVTVVVNGEEIVIDSQEDFELIEDIFDESDDDEDLLEIIFPITVVLSNFSEITISNQDEFEDLADDCNGENEEDEDIECIDFVYPITVNVFNTLTEVNDELTINNDKEFFNLIDDLEDNEVVTIVFPVSLTLSDGSLVEANSLELLENLLDDAKDDDCDEDDDYDYDDDDCEDCTTDELTNVFVNCQDWIIDDFEVNDENLEDNYENFRFNFSSDGSLIAYDGSSTINGNWTATGSGENLIVTISLPDFPDFAGEWKLEEYDDGDDKEVELSKGDDKLEFESDNCN